MVLPLSQVGQCSDDVRSQESELPLANLQNQSPLREMTLQSVTLDSIQKRRNHVPIQALNLIVQFQTDMVYP